MSTIMTLEEALKLAEEAKEQGYLNKYPQAVICLSKELETLQTKYLALEKEHTYWMNYYSP